MGVRVIYHIACARDWDAARAAGEYRHSTRGRTLEEVGFIHASQAHQVESVANAFYQGEEDLLLLVIDPQRVRSPIRYDPLPGSQERYPHIYGPLNVDSVVRVLPLRAAADGRFSFSVSPPDQGEAPLIS